MKLVLTCSNDFRPVSFPVRLHNTIQERGLDFDRLCKKASEPKGRAAAERKKIVS